MKTLLLHLQAAQIDTSTLVPLFDASESEAGYRLALPGNQALDAWDTLRGLVAKTGYWPVILGDAEELEYIAESAEGHHWGTTRELIEKAQGYSGEGWVEATFEEFLGSRREDLEYLKKEGSRNKRDREAIRSLEAELASTDPFRCMPRGDWPDGIEPSDSLSTPFHFRTGQPHPETFLALVPTTVSWQVPIYLHFGGFNDCPHPLDHAIMLRYWQERHDAEVICLTHDVLELVVGAPASTREEALRLAREQYLYCRDIVEQGTQTIDHLAAELLHDRTWFFWWD